MAPQLLSSSLSTATPANILLDSAGAYAVSVLGYALISTLLAALGLCLLLDFTFATTDTAFFALLATRGAITVPRAEASVQDTYPVKSPRHGN